MPPTHPIAPLAQFDSGRYRPATFLLRGVAIPFTTPYLLGGRIRPGVRSGAELVLGNPAGEDGVYILPWSALSDICTPTLHDRALWDHIAGLQVLAPRTIRDAARGIASAGHAGRAAARAAEVALARDRDARTRTHYHLLLELLRQGEAGSGAGPPFGPVPEQESLRGLESRARAVLLALEPGAEAAPLAAFQALAEVAEAFSHCGLPGNPAAAMVPALVDEIATLAEELAAWARQDHGPASGPASGREPGLALGPQRSCVRLIGQSAALTLRCCRLALAEAHAALADLPDLLRHWRPSPGPDSRIRLGRDRDIRLRAARPEWLLDGWALICGLWRTADPSRRHLALLDMAAMVPVIPAEVGEWLGIDLDADLGADMEAIQGGLTQWRRMVQPNQDWMSGRILDLIARNEGLRAATA